MRSISVAQFFLGNLKESANRTARRLIFAFLLFSLFCFSAGGGSAFGGLFSIPSAQAFEGPMQGPGQGTGAFGFTGGRFAVGTSTPLSDTRFVIIATSTEPGNYAMKVVYNKCDASQSTCPQSALPAVFSIRNDGSVVMGGGYFGTPSGGSSYYEPPNSTYERGLTVWGPTFINGPANAMSFLGGDIDPTLLTSGVFNTKGTNGPFAFRGSLGIATTTKDALPQPLSVYGGGYFSGNVGIGTVNPSSTLHVVGSIQQTSITSNFVYATTTGGFVGVSLGSNLVLSGGVLSSTGGSVTTSSAITANYIPYWTAATGSLNGTSTIYIKSDGKIGIGTSNPTSSLSVAGNIFATGSITGDSISGTFSGTVPAENVSPGVFATGNSSFQSSLGVGTSSATGLPSKLSVYGDEYVSGNLNLSATNDSATGVIKAGANRFLHGYSGSQAGTSVFLGTDAGNFTMSGYRNVGIGQEVLLPNTSGYLNTAVGYRALYSNNTGYGNSVIGDSALYNNTTGIMNSAVGYQILNGNTTSSYNAAVGGYALGGNANGGYGAAVGYNALVNSVGKGNSAIGYTAGKTSYGSYNSFLGYNAGRSVTDGTVNSSSSIIIGSKVGMPGDSVGRWLNIGNLLYGTGIYDASQGADTAVSATPVTDGKIGIGTYQPSSTLHVIGGGMFTGNVTTTNLTVSGISGSTQCLQVSSAGVVSGSGGTCGGSGSVSTSSPITANYIPYWTSVSGGLNGTSSVYASGASIGIGTTQPSSTLHVIGTITGTTLSGSFSGTVNASNVSAGTFASGNSNFQSSLGVGTSTATG
ncbi:MAG: hypothetical protein HYY10_03260, partial [Candidatus Liptonbacteria bacterium]|nr:hypothetical protein [Candidatus Liptonbacteria bacterium]